LICYSRAADAKRGPTAVRKESFLCVPSPTASHSLASDWARRAKGARFRPFGAPAWRDSSLLPPESPHDLQLHALGFKTCSRGRTNTLSNLRSSRIASSKFSLELPDAVWQRMLRRDLSTMRNSLRSFRLRSRRQGVIVVFRLVSSSLPSRLSQNGEPANRRWL
jgi:hypothetical protein